MSGNAARSTEFPVVDAQVHAYAEDCDRWPWARSLPDLDPPVLTGDQLVAAMDAVGVDRALLVSPRNVYQTDTRYAEHVYREHPDRFRLVAPFNPREADVGAQVDAWAATPGAVGVRVMLLPRSDQGAGHPGVAAIVERATAAGLPVCVLCWERLPGMDELAAAFPDTQFVVDHLGIWQPIDPPVPPDPFADLDLVLALARRPNVAVKFSGVCTFSHRPFPYDDLWDPVGRVIEAFGIERCLWGTDWQRATHLLSYAAGRRRVPRPLAAHRRRARRAHGRERAAHLRLVIGRRAHPDDRRTLGLRRPRRPGRAAGDPGGPRWPRRRG